MQDDVNLLLEGIHGSSYLVRSSKPMMSSHVLQDSLFDALHCTSPQPHLPATGERFNGTRLVGFACKVYCVTLHGLAWVNRASSLTDVDPGIQGLTNDLQKRHNPSHVNNRHIELILFSECHVDKTNFHSPIISTNTS